jgi:pimeloyl-ACP methyl ester carboxylesterase
VTASAPEADRAGGLATNETVWLAAPKAASDLILMLPGAYTRASHFVEAGFARARDALAPHADLAVIDLDPAAAGFGHIARVLGEQIAQAARAARYDQIWLGGVSLGGMLVLDYLAREPASIAGVCLLAPYPGTRITHQELRAAGGARAWAEREESRRSSDPEVRGWSALLRRPAGFPIYFGYGRDDRFAAGMRLFADALPAASIDALDGAHDWGVWGLLWRRFLVRGALGQTARRVA